MTPIVRRAIAAGGLVGGVLALGIGLTWYLMGGGLDRTIKELPPDEPVTGPRKTGYKRIDAFLGTLSAASRVVGIPLGLMVGWIAKESGGKLSDTTNLDERGYFQLMPAESEALGVDHQRLSTDSDYSIQSGVDLIHRYQKTVDALSVAAAGSSYYWKLVKLVHSMGAGQVKKVVKAAQAAGSADTWTDLSLFAQGMKINGPQPKKWFPFVDLVYTIGKPFGFGSEESSVGSWADIRGREALNTNTDTYAMRGLDLLGAERVV